MSKPTPTPIEEVFAKGVKEMNARYALRMETSIASPESGVEAIAGT